MEVRYCLRYEVIRNAGSRCISERHSDCRGSGNTDTLSLDTYGNLQFVQHYFRANRHWFYDMDDYISQICPDEVLYSAFNDAMEKVVIYKASTPSFMKDSGGFDITHFSGVSTYVYRPKNSYLKEYYSKLDWGAVIGLK